VRADLRGRRRAVEPRFNRRANSFQINPNKTKQKSLDFLGLIGPNRDFSMGYEQKNKKNRLALMRLRLPFPLANGAARRFDSGNMNMYTSYF
jgi:hypothetical protein